MALFLYLCFPALQLQSAVRQLQSEPDSRENSRGETEPAQSPLPFAVVNAQHELIQLNAAAAAKGIKLGMTLGSAAALCHELQLLPYQPQLQHELLSDVAQQLYQHSAEIALDPPDGLYLNLTNMLRLYQGLAGYWQHLATAINRLAYDYHFATGTTALMAKCLARQKLDLISADKAELDTRLAQTPLSVTDLDGKLQQQLKRLGLHTLGQLLTLSSAELARRFDSTLLSYLGRLRGDFYHALEYIQPTQGFSRSLELLYDISDTAVLCSPLNTLLQQLEQQLLQSDALCHQLQLQLSFRQHKALQLAVSSAQGEYRAANWLPLCQLQLEQLKLPEAVVAVKLDVARFYPQQAKTAALFENGQDAMSALQLVSLLQARLGATNVAGLNLADQHVPEQATQQSLPVLTEKQNIVPLGLRPAFLLPKVQPLLENVQINAGPERLCPDPWQLQLQRDYFIARNSKGQWLWVYRTAEQRWFIQGLFS